MKKRSQVKCKIGDNEYYIDCTVHSTRLTYQQNAVELLVRIGKTVLWVPRSDVNLAGPIKMTLDLK